MENTQEQELSLINLFWKVVFGWRRLFVMGILFAVLISGLQYARSQTSLKKRPGNRIDEEIVLSQDEQTKVDDVLALQKHMDELRDYQKNSIWMNLDAYNEPVLVLRYYVDSDYTFNYTEESASDYTKDVAAAYCSYVKSGIVADTVAEKLNLSDQTNYISELITAEGGDSEDRSTGIFEITAAYSDAETLEQIRPVIAETIEAQTERISREIGSHTLKLIAENISVRVDKNLLLAQKEKNDAMYSYRTQLSAMETGLNEAQKAALENARKEDAEPEDADIVEIAKPAFSIKYAILGFMVGVFLACVWIFLEVLFMAKIQDAEEMSELYGVRILGELSTQKQKKKLFYFVDSLLLKWKECNKKQISQEQQIRIAGSNIVLACKKAGISQLYVTGSGIENQTGDSMERIWKHLSEEGIQVHRGESIVYDAGSLKEMAEIGNVVFVEQIDVSLYTEIEKEVKAAKANGIEIIGSVVIV